MYFETNRCDSGPYGSDFSLALRAVLGARIPENQLSLSDTFGRLTGKHEGDLSVLLWHVQLEARSGYDEVDLQLSFVSSVAERKRAANLTTA